MAIRRKAAPKQTPRPMLRRKPAPAPFDLVRNPNFDAAMAQQRYDQMLADMTARAKAGQFDTRIDDVGQQSTNSTAGYVQVDPNRAGYMPVDPNTNMPTLMPIQPPQGQQGAMASQYQNPQGQQQQMQNYQNFLQQGMQNSNTLNQGAMNNFANMQPGMQATQTASTTTPNQTMPVAGMGMQQPKQTQPRKFSTVRNSPARFA